MQDGVIEKRQVPDEWDHGRAEQGEVLERPALEAGTPRRPIGRQHEQRNRQEEDRGAENVRAPADDECRVDQHDAGKDDAGGEARVEPSETEPNLVEPVLDALRELLGHAAAGALAEPAGEIGERLRTPDREHDELLYYEAGRGGDEKGRERKREPADERGVVLRLAEHHEHDHDRQRHRKAADQTVEDRDRAPEQGRRDDQPELGDAPQRPEQPIQDESEDNGVDRREAERAAVERQRIEQRERKPDREERGSAAALRGKLRAQSQGRRDDQPGEQRVAGGEQQDGGVLERHYAQQQRGGRDGSVDIAMIVDQLGERTPARTERSLRLQHGRERVAEGMGRKPGPDGGIDVELSHRHSRRNGRLQPRLPRRDQHGEGEAIVAAVRIELLARRQRQPIDLRECSAARRLGGDLAIACRIDPGQREAHRQPRRHCAEREQDRERKDGMKCHSSRHGDNMLQFRARLGRRQALRLDSAGFYPQAKASINVPRSGCPRASARVCWPDLLALPSTGRETCGPGTSGGMEHSEDLAATARFFDRAIGELAGFARAGKVRVLDFGCGAGELVGHLLALGYDAHGCDIVLASDAPGIAAAPQRFKQIAQAPYRLPYDDASFDVVLSTSVLEHARNPEEYLVEIRRVLAPGGVAMHLLPGKWYLPYERTSAFRSRTISTRAVPRGGLDCGCSWASATRITRTSIGARRCRPAATSTTTACSISARAITSGCRGRCSEIASGRWRSTSPTATAGLPGSVANCRCAVCGERSRANSAWASSCSGSRRRRSLVRSEGIHG